MTDSELDELKRKRMEQLKQAYGERVQRQADEQRAEQEGAEQLAALEEAVKSRLTKEALQRYGTVKLAHPETATRIIIAVAQAIESGRLKGMLSEEQLISALQQLSNMTAKRETKIIRK